MALETRMQSELADFMERWALLWERSGLVWYTLVSEHGGLRDLPGFLSSGAQCSQPGVWEAVAGAVCCSCPSRVTAGTCLRADWGLLPAASLPARVISPVLAALTHQPRVRWDCSIPALHVL